MAATNQETLTGKLTKVADAIRDKNGTTDKMTLDDMADTISALGAYSIDDIIKFIKETYSGSSTAIQRWNDANSSSYQILNGLLNSKSGISSINRRDFSFFANMSLIPRISSEDDYVKNNDEDIKQYNLLVDKIKQIFESNIATYTNLIPYMFSELTLPVYVWKDERPGADSVSAAREHKTIYTIKNVKKVGLSAFSGAFYGLYEPYCTALYFPDCVSIESFSFSDCEMRIINLPKVTNLPGGAFRSFGSGEGTYFIKIGGDIDTIDASQYNGIFYSTYDRNSRSDEELHIILSGNKVPTLENVGGLFSYVDSSCSISGNGGNLEIPKNAYFYVPKALLEEYKTATNWSAFSTQLRAIEDYPDICILPGDEGYTGEFTSTNPTAEGDAQ